MLVTYKAMGKALERSFTWIKQRRWQLSYLEIIGRRRRPRGNREFWCLDGNLLKWAGNGGMSSPEDKVWALRQGMTFDELKKKVRALWAKREAA